MVFHAASRLQQFVGFRLLQHMILKIRLIQISGLRPDAAAWAIWTRPAMGSCYLCAVSDLNSLFPRKLIFLRDKLKAFFGVVKTNVSVYRNKNLLSED